MSHNNYTTNLLDFQDKDLVIDACTNEGDVKKIFVHKPLECSNTSCIHCGSLVIRTHGYYQRKIKFLEVTLRKTIVLYNQRRFKCCDCSKTFNESCCLVEKGSTISNQSKQKILEKLRTKSSFTDVSREMDVSITTTFNEFYKHIADYRCLLSNTICLDEFKASTIAGKYALIIGDPISGKILDILPSRKQDYIYYYFQSITKEERLSVQYIVTDLFESYRTIVKNLFWKSIHIVDRFHWIKLATEAFNNTRIKIMNSYLKLGNDQGKGSFNKYIKYANVLKKYHRILVANRYAKEGWFFDQVTVASYLQKEMTLQEIIEYCLNHDSDLEEAYDLLQSLYKLAKFSTPDDARKNIIDWCDRIDENRIHLSEFKRVSLTYRNWINEICNSFIINPITKSRMTNGFIEGKNNFCKVIKRIGFGYQNFDVFRAKILYTNDPDRPYKN